MDGTGLTLAHEDGQPRWVAVSDAAMELLEQIQDERNHLADQRDRAADARDRVTDEPK